MKVFQSMLAAFALTGLGSAGATAQHAWVQYDGLGKAQARVIVPKGANGATMCPDLTHDAGTVSLTLRSDVAPANFDEIRVCVGAVDASMANMTVAGISLPTPTTSPQKVAVVGDTGCRVKGGDVQDCDGAKAAKATPQATDTSGDLTLVRPPWDYVGLANATAAQSPDLLIHVGDMHYREYGYCGTKCDQRTVGYSWISWQADYFAPSKNLFAAAPMIPVRGNHEDCSRAWNGWFYLLDPNPIELTGDWPTTCPGTLGQNGQPNTPVDAGGNDWNYTLPYPVVFDDFQVIVMDTSRIDRALIATRIRPLIPRWSNNTPPNSVASN
ncbi:MAG: metallophosphoesterase [Ascidiaceihabitans sp.]|nr:metallophosphoesterase [Ascidiaceihabitans sp.]